jgi:hypothetical protein
MNALYTITVSATGKYAKEALSLYTLTLHGPGDFALLRDTGRFDSSGVCRFTNLPMGNYWVVPDTKADVGWSVTPSRAEVGVGPSQPGAVFINFGGGWGGPNVRVRDQGRRR